MPGIEPVEHIDALLQLQGETFVRAAYRALLGREPDAVGMRSHMALLRSGRDPRLLLLGLAKSPEATARREPRLAGLDEFLARVDEELPSRWQRWLQARLAQLQRPLFNRIAILDDQLVRTNRLLAEQAESMRKLIELNRQQSDWLDDLQRQLSESTPDRRLSPEELSELHRLSAGAQALYNGLRVARRSPHQGVPA